MSKYVRLKPYNPAVGHLIERFTLTITEDDPETGSKKPTGYIRFIDSEWRILDDDLAELLREHMEDDRGLAATIPAFEILTEREWKARIAREGKVTDEKKVTATRKFVKAPAVETVRHVRRGPRPLETDEVRMRRAR